MAPDSSVQAGEVVDALVQLSFLIQTVLARIAATHDMTIVQVRLLGVLRDRSPGMMEIARFLNLDKSSVTGLVDRAERRGLVQRSTTPEDGRAVRVSLTPLGQQLTREAEAEVAREIRTLTANLSETERSQLVAIAAKLFHHTSPTS